MELMSQPFTGYLGNRLIENLESDKYHTMNIAVAFAKNSGVLRLKDSFQRFRARGGKINAIVGVDLGGTSYEALTALLLYTDTLSVVHAEKAQTFHVKVYQFVGDGEGLVVVGSHNLTGGGLWTNFEASILVADHEAKAFKAVEKHFEKLGQLDKSFMPIGDQDAIEALLANNYITKEIAERVRHAKSKPKKGAQKELFGKGIPVKLPKIVATKKKKEEVSDPSPNLIFVPQGDEGDTIWFETRKMTGGSRNILDLSKKSLIEIGDPTNTAFDLGDKKFMRGGVEFFGLDPDSTHESKDITINFDGVDYAGNTIKYPDGDKANGTWRIQIKGESSSGVKITEAFRAKGEEHYLVGKVITFTKVVGDYYFMSVFPENDLEHFKSASYILARNGQTADARLLGLL
ncbi:phospholipase D-like domain-containing protein [Hyphobacterium marinum]|uniref:Phospholipase D-like domain-containing protein n=1 Tax=Hyphobacterium marinum TaxID=3116574 RepID=A0ABU7LUK7_9PROT|nr:phospholipase D-like domain-containing protein [Hyphobacterium sp. Y6023]MEE2565235.1 phospholipase D-like domain-containing protein [Hyphobacterium sp. Y6023]